MEFLKLNDLELNPAKYLIAKKYFKIELSPII